MLDAVRKTSKKSVSALHFRHQIQFAAMEEDAGSEITLVPISAC